MKGNMMTDVKCTVEEQFAQNPKVSIIIPMYNAVSTLKETIQSVQEQTYSDWELILVDDCSEDNTLMYAREFAEKDNRIRVFETPENGGPGFATKVGAEYVTGNFVAFLDADDLWIRDKLERQIQYMVKNNYEFVCSDYCWIDSQGKELGRTIKCKQAAGYKTVIRSCPIGSSTVMLTTRLLKKVDIPIIRKNNDYALWLQLLRDGTKVYGMQDVLMKYRIIATSNSFNKRKMIKYFWEVYREYEGFSVIKSGFLLGRYVLIKAIGIK